MEDALHTAIEALERAIQSRKIELTTMERSLAQLKGSAPHFSSPPKTTEWEGMGITEAAQKWLTEVGPKHTVEIAEALLDHGVQTTSRNFRGTVYSTLAQNTSKFYRKGDLWHLTKK